jgi:phospholipase/carboxylesterase
MATLETVEHEPRGSATHSVIWLHGLGADGHDFEPIVPALRLHDRPVRFVFPHAPIRPVTINAGFRMRAWYDVVGLERGSPEDVEGIRASGAAVAALVDREVERGVPSSRIVLAGFSQGGAIALHAGLRYPHRLAGLIGLSTYLPRAESTAAETSPANGSLPVFLAHGTEDPIVPIAMGRWTRDELLRHGYPVRFETYPMAHAVSPEEVLDIRAWLLEVWDAMDGPARPG